MFRLSPTPQIVRVPPKTGAVQQYSSPGGPGRNPGVWTGGGGVTPGARQCIMGLTAFPVQSSLVQPKGGQKLQGPAHP